MVLTACQRPEPPVVIEQKPKQAVAEQAVDLKSICRGIEQEMREINQQRTTFALEQINQDLKVCLPLMDFPDQQHLLELSAQMYQNFLKVERTAQQQTAFDQYAFDLAQHPTIQQSHFEQFALRDQYLLKHKGQAYVDLYDAGEGQLVYRRNPQYLARIFAPYLPDAERIFIENLAEQNMQHPIRDGGLTIDAQEVVRRALFWEDYVKNYPDSSYIRDARYLDQVYRMFLFKGTLNTPVSDSYEAEYAIQPSVWYEIEKLAKLEQSRLADQARKFRSFVQMSPQERRNRIPVSLTAQEQNNERANTLALKQLSHYLDLPLNGLSPTRDCFSDAVCMPYQNN
ncbi:hypothetical protein [Acinetobacter indicus]|uniref:hypothetical protein n=1 Tax=Acinetobacter indicus TaxID=756892 RepID=UPI0014902F78|nr:hypothetical protein [Acinetobacter indicus]